MTARLIHCVALTLCSACGEPLLATVGVMDVEDARVDSGLDASMLSTRPDAQSDEPSLDSGLAAPDLGNCLWLPNFGTGRVLPKDAGLANVFDDEAGLRVATDVHYNCADGGMSQDQIFSHIDGEPMLKAGVRYAVRMELVQVAGPPQGFNDACERPLAPPMQAVFFVPACHDVSAVRDARYLRFSGGLNILPATPLTKAGGLRLCDEPCQ